MVNDDRPFTKRRQCYTQGNCNSTVAGGRDPPSERQQKNGGQKNNDHGVGGFIFSARHFSAQ
jgi:hypothetical protein